MFVATASLRDPRGRPDLKNAPPKNPARLPSSTKPYEFIGFGAMDGTKPYKFIGFGAMDVTKPYKFIGFGATDVTKPYKCVGSGAMDGTKTL